MMRKILITFLVVAALLFGVALSIPYLLNINRFREPILKAAAERTGYKIVVGDMSWKLIPFLTIHLEGFSVEDTQKKDIPFSAKAEGLELALRWKPLLQKNIEIRRLDITRGVLHIADPHRPGKFVDVNVDHLSLGTADVQSGPWLEAFRKGFSEGGGWQDLAGRARLTVEGLDAGILRSFANVQDLKGKANLEVRLRQSQGTLLFDMDFNGDDVALRVPDKFKKTAGEPFKLRAKGFIKNQLVTLEKGDMEFSAAELTLRKTSYDLGTHNFKADIRAILRLEDVLAWMEDTGGAVAKGKAAMDAEISGNTERLRDVQIEGTMELQDMRLRWPGVLRRGIEGRGSVRFARDSIAIRSLELQVGKTDLRLDGKIELATKSPGKINFDSRYLDVEELLNLFEKPPPRDERIKAPAAFLGAPVMAASGEKGLGQWSFQGECKIGELVWQRNRLTNLTGKLLLDKGAFTLSRFAGTGYRGELSTAFQIDLLDPQLAFRWGIRTTGVDLNEVLVANSDFRGKVYGSLDSQLECSGRITGGSSGLLKSLEGAGQVEVKEMRIATFSMMEKLSLLTGLLGIGQESGRGDTRLEYLKTGVRIGNGRVVTPDVQGRGDEFDLAGRGSFGFDKTIDYDLQIRLSREVTSRLGQGELVRALLGEDGTMVIPFRLTGLLDGPPKLKPMWQDILTRQATHRLGDYLRDKVFRTEPQQQPGEPVPQKPSQEESRGTGLEDLIFDILTK